MTVASELDRIEKAKGDIRTAIENQGETVPAEETIDKYAAHINNISGGRENLLVNSDFLYPINPSGETYWDKPGEEIIPGWKMQKESTIKVQLGDHGLYLRGDSIPDEHTSGIIQNFPQEIVEKLYNKPAQMILTFGYSNSPNGIPGTVHSFPIDFVFPGDNLSSSRVAGTIGTLEYTIHSGDISLCPASPRNTYEVVQSVSIVLKGANHVENPNVSRVKSFGYNPVLATADMTQPVGVKNGKFFTTPDAISKIRGASVGDLIKVKSVDAAGVPTSWEKTSLEELEGKWELIEDLTLNTASTIQRTAYKLKALTIELKVTADCDFSNIFLMAGKETFYEYCKFTTALNKTVYKIFTNKGYWDSVWGAPSAHIEFCTPRMPCYRESMQYPIVDYPYISGFYTGELPAGSNMKIWGVRA